MSFVQPTTLGRYRILERLGAGGMGVVYRAEDPRLEREVALKVIRQDTLRDDDARRRFRQEARALSRLLHPNIATLFDFDSDGETDFLVLEYVPGETLAHMLESGPLPEARARAIAIEVADALQAAHAEGLVHRDLKPGNVLVTPRGRAKVVDFGLARFNADVAGLTHAQTATNPSIIAGTVPYMAPEQLMGERVDARTDLHALGAMLFETLTGRPPFGAGDIARVLYAIANHAAPSVREARPEVSPEMEAVVARCLEKQPSRRYADAAALLRALRGDRSEAVEVGTVSRTAPGASNQRSTAVAASISEPGIHSLAVLPFENRSGNPEQEFFADGMTDALITDLAQIGALRVISRTSAMRFKGTTRPLAEIARELRVDAIVEGSALRAGDRVRISVNLVDAAADRGLWARSYERDLTDILSLQSEVARAIAEEIRAKLTPDEHARLEARGPVNPTAHLAYLQGRFLWNRWTTESLKESVQRYEEALAADPKYALAWAGLADSHNVLGNTNAMPPREAYSRAREAAEKGLTLDPNLAELHASLAYIHRFHDWDWPRAEREFLRAIQLNAGYASGRRWYAQFLSGMGRHDEAIAEAERALELDPLSLVIYTAVGDVLFYARRYERAIEYYRKCIAMDPTFPPGRTDIARALDQVGRSEEGLQEFLSVTPLVDGKPHSSTGLAAMLARAGRAEEGRAMIETLLAQAGTRFVSPYGVASFYAITGDHGAALDWLERAYEQRDGTLVWIKVHPRMDPLRGEPRFRELLTRMKLD